MKVGLSVGTVEYEDSGGSGPVLVFLHGLLMSSSLWSEVVEALSPDYRCIAPTLPLGAHRLPMPPGTDLSLPGIARVVAEFLAALDLREVTLIGNDTGGALVQLLMTDGPPSIARAVLVSCDAFDNFPPGLTGKTLVASGRLTPTLFGLFMQQLRIRPIRRLPIAFGWLTKRGDAVTARWLRPVLRRAAIRRDTVRVLREIAAAPTLLVDAAKRLPDFDRPTLIVWAAEDRVMPPEHGRRLAELLPRAELVEIPDSYTLIPLDQPRRLASEIRRFAASRARPAGSSPCGRSSITTTRIAP
jgi:pimeloyl-ACP methyl ester carboxylesterase